MFDFKPGNFVNAFLKQNKSELKIWMRCFREYGSKDPLTVKLEQLWL